MLGPNPWLDDGDFLPFPVEKYGAHEQSITPAAWDPPQTQTGKGLLPSPSWVAPSRPCGAFNLSSEAKASLG